MAKKSLTYLIYNDLSAAVNGLAKKTFFGRPKTTNEELTDFLVIQPMTTLNGWVARDRDMVADCYGTIDVYCKAKSDGTLNVNTQTVLVQKVVDKFPINGVHITATNPRELLTGEDNTGYQVTRITFRVRTKLNARNTQ